VVVHQSGFQELTNSRGAAPVGGLLRFHSFIQDHQFKRVPAAEAFHQQRCRRMFRSLCGLIFSLTFGSACFAQSLVLDVVSVAQSHDARTGRPMVELVLGQKSKPALSAFSSAEIGHKVELRVDGRVVAAPVIREPLSTSMQISDAGWTDEVAAAIADELAKPAAKIELVTVNE
jgi:hypothetical protein